MKSYSGTFQLSTSVSRLFLLEIFPFLKGMKVLDIDCGPGEYLYLVGKDSLKLDNNQSFF